MSDSANIYERYMPVIDVSDGIKRVMNNKKLYLSLMERFKARDMVMEVVTQITQRNPSMIVQKAHALKGTAGNLGFPALREIAKTIEERAKAGTEYADLAAPLQEALAQAEDMIALLLENEL